VKGELSEREHLVALGGVQARGVGLQLGCPLSDGLRRGSGAGGGGRRRAEDAVVQAVASCFRGHGRRQKVSLRLGWQFFVLLK